METLCETVGEVISADPASAELGLLPEVVRL